MELDDLIIISVDDHVVEPPTMFDRHLTAQQRQHAPRSMRGPDGVDFWWYEGRKLPNIGLNAVAGRVREEHGCEPASYDQMRKGAWDVDARVDDMNVNGILASLNFGSFVGFDGFLFATATDKKHALTNLKAYNDWHIDEWCAAHPGRFIPMAILPVWDIAEVVAEVRRVSTKGCHAVAFSDNPARKGLPSIHNPYWTPLWDVCAELDIVICVHIGSGNAAPHASMESPVAHWVVGMPMSIAHSAADWLFLEAFRRHPNLKVALSEGGIGWVPYFRERADFVDVHQSAWTHFDFGGTKPSEVFRKHFITCFIDDRVGIKMRHEIGVETMCYECDYPHSDSLWPRAPEHLWSCLQGVPDDEINLITHGNAMRMFSFDPFTAIDRKSGTVGALRAKAQHVDVTPRSFGGPAPLAQGERPRVVTSGDVIRMFEGVLGGNAEAN